MLLFADLSFCFFAAPQTADVENKKFLDSLRAETPEKTNVPAGSRIVSGEQWAKLQEEVSALCETVRSCRSGKSCRSCGSCVDHMDRVDWVDRVDRVGRVDRMDRVDRVDRIFLALLQQLSGFVFCSDNAIEI